MSIFPASILEKSSKTCSETPLFQVLIYVLHYWRQQFIGERTTFLDVRSSMLEAQSLRIEAGAKIKKKSRSMFSGFKID